MANRRISELQEIAGLNLADADLLTVVQTAEVDPAIKNKKLTISGTKAYLNVYYLSNTGGTVAGSVIIQNDLTVSGATTVNTINSTGTSTLNALIVKTDATVTGTISGGTITGTYIKGTNISGQTVSGATVTGTHGKFTNLTATNITGTTFTGTTANFTNVTAQDFTVDDDFIVADDVRVSGDITWNPYGNCNYRKYKNFISFNYWRNSCRYHFSFRNNRYRYSR